MRQTALAALAMLLSIAPDAACAQPVDHERQTVPGLSSRAEIIVDRWGVPHIYAASERDAYFLQGYNAARDRLWQIDLWRKRGLGRLAASLGPAYVARDRAARLFLYRGSLKAEWARYAPGSRARYAAFAQGINAYVDAVLAGEQPLPREFTLTGSKPEHWQADELIRIRSHTLVLNAAQEVMRARTACAAGVDADRLRVRLYPDRRTSVPDGLDPCAVTPEMMTDYLLATGDVPFEPAKSTLAEAAEDGRMEGSNNWVIAPSHSATGRPILSNDPHRALTVPSLRYVVHLEAPGLSLTGAGEPALPGVAFGHNADAAFGLTIFGTDQEDLYLYDLKPGDPYSYRYGKSWEKMRVVQETIAVKGAAPETVTLAYTRHGPVLSQDASKNRALALRTVWTMPGASGYAAASWLAKARNWADFRRAADHWGAPPLNLIWADRSGAIGWAAAGLVPVRPNWDGLLPVPGDGRYEWRGVLKPAGLPQLRDPPQGWIATANQYNLPADQPVTPPIGYEWADPTRFDRIAKILSAKPRISVAEAATIQMDQHSETALRLIALIASMKAEEKDATRALDLLRGWDANTTTDSIAATIYECWTTQHLGRSLARHAAPAAQAIIDRGSPDAALHVLETRDPLLGPDPDAAIDAILRESLMATLADLRERLGRDMTQWQWGRLHQIRLAPPIAALADAPLRTAMTIGPEPVGGSGSTPALTHYRGGNFAAVHGASVRFTFDVGDWDKSLFVNMPGQAGDSASPHYRDLLPRWLNGDFAPLAFSRPAVEAVAERIIALEPRR